MTFNDYESAWVEAYERAKTWRVPQGIERSRDLSGRDYYVVKSLPKPGNRYGVDARCEAVEVPSQ